MSQASYSLTSTHKSSVKTKLMFNIGNVYILHDGAKAQYQ